MKPRYSTDYLTRIYEGDSVFDLWALLTTLERRVSLPERSWLVCRLVEWMSATRSGVRTYHEATSAAAQSRVSAAVRHYPQLLSVSEYYDRGMRTWKSEQEIGEVDRWIDSHEGQIHSSLMQMARDERALIMKLNAEPDASPNGGPATRLGNSGVTEGPPSVS
jgi:hypothetical protein